MIVALAADHAGRPLLDRVAEVVRAEGHTPLFVGEPGHAPDDDYPDIARAVGRAVVAGDAERGVILCGSGAGVAVAANKLHGIRAAVAHDAYTARQMVEHDDVNVLAMGSRVIGSELAADVVATYLRAGFNGEERHRRRLAKVVEMEKEGA